MPGPTPVHSIQLILGIVIGILLSLGALQARTYYRSHKYLAGKLGEPITKQNDDLIIGLLVVASFSIGAFLTFILMSINL